MSILYSQKHLFLYSAVSALKIVSNHDNASKNLLAAVIDPFKKNISHDKLESMKTESIHTFKSVSGSS